MGLLLIVGFFSVWLFLNGISPWYALDGASLFIVLIPPVALVIAARGESGLKLIARALFRSNMDEDSAPAAAKLLRLMGRAALAAGIIGALLAAGQVLTTLHAFLESAATRGTILKQLGAAAAAILITPTYGLFFKYFVFEAAAARLDSSSRDG